MTLTLSKMAPFTSHELHGIDDQYLCSCSPCQFAYSLVKNIFATFHGTIQGVYGDEERCVDSLVRHQIILAGIKYYLSESNDGKSCGSQRILSPCGSWGLSSGSDSLSL